MCCVIQLTVYNATHALAKQHVNNSQGFDNMFNAIGFNLTSSKCKIACRLNRAIKKATQKHKELMSNPQLLKAAVDDSTDGDVKKLMQLVGQGSATIVFDSKSRAELQVVLLVARYNANASTTDTVVDLSDRISDLNKWYQYFETEFPESGLHTELTPFTM